MPYNDPFGNPLVDWQEQQRRAQLAQQQGMIGQEAQNWNPQQSQPAMAQPEQRPGQQAGTGIPQASIDPRPGGSINAGPGGLENYGENAGPYGMTWGLPKEDFGDMPEMSSSFGDTFDRNFEGNTRAVAGNVANAYNYNMPQANAAQMGLGGIPQPNAQQFGTSAELQSMLSGEGWDPKTMAQMRSRAIDDVSGAGRTEMGQASRAMERAGLSGSPAGAAVAGDVARRSGIQQNSALRDIDIGSAMQGIQNKQFGIGQQTGIGMGNMQQANSMALANANRLFSGMSQNLGHQQQANMSQFGAETERLGSRANAEGNVWSNAGSQYNQGALGLFGEANRGNVNNRIRRQEMEQGARARRSEAMFNAGEGRNNQAINILGNQPYPGQPDYNRPQGFDFTGRETR